MNFKLATSNARLKRRRMFYLGQRFFVAQTNRMHEQLGFRIFGVVSSKYYVPHRTSLDYIPLFPILRRVTYCQGMWGGELGDGGLLC